MGGKEVAVILLVEDIVSRGGVVRSHKFFFGRPFRLPADSIHEVAVVVVGLGNLGVPDAEVVVEGRSRGNDQVGNRDLDLAGFENNRAVGFGRLVVEKNDPAHFRGFRDAFEAEGARLDDRGVGLHAVAEIDFAAFAAAVEDCTVDDVGVVVLAGKDGHKARQKGKDISFHRIVYFCKGTKKRADCTKSSYLCKV